MKLQQLGSTPLVHQPGLINPGILVENGERPPFMENPDPEVSSTQLTIGVFWVSGMLQIYR